MEQLIILPGLLCDSRMFAAQVSAFDAAVIDGFYGQADRIEAMADYALKRMPARCALLGHSMGARVALEIWRMAPERIARLALADTGIHAVRDGERTERYRLRDIGREQGAEALVDAWLPLMIGKAHRANTGLFALLRTMAVDAGTATFERQIEALLHRPEAAPTLATIACPVLAVVGRDDEWSPVAQHEAITAQIPDATLRVVENAGHMAPVEEPRLFNNEIRDWLTWPAKQLLYSN